MLASGLAALAYQIVWTQQFTVWLGHESSAVLAVVGAFFGGLAAGSFAFGRRIEASAQPARWYAACEAVIGLWCLVLLWLLEPAGAWLLERIGTDPAPLWQWSVAFAGTFALLLPATVAMGATLPAMERVLAPWRAQGSALAALYAANTLGAVAGVLAAAFWLVPAMGLARTALSCAALNLLCAAIAWSTFAPRRGTRPAAPAVPAQHGQAAPSAGLLALLAATGLLGIGYEVMVVRVLRQVCENTVYTFALLLAVYLIGTAAGAAAYQRWLARRATAHENVDARLLLALAFACLIGTASLWGAESFKAALLDGAPPGMASALVAEATLAALAFGPPTLLMGALFSHLAARAARAGLGLGRPLACNTLGAALAPPLFGVLLAGALGPKDALLVVAAGYAALALAVSTVRTQPRWPGVVLAGAAAALALWAPPLQFVEIPDGGRLVSYRDGAQGAVSVVEDAGGVLRLRIDNRQQEGSSATGFSDARQALIPLLLHPAPRQALFLGLGTGATARAAARDGQLRVDAVELLPEVVEAAALFARATDTATGTQPQVHVADARRHVRASRMRYDVVVSDNFHPARSGSASLYTVEHFEAVRARLADGGLFCQWLPLHQLDPATLRPIVRAFLAAFPDATAVLATHSLETPVLGLVARAPGGPVEIDRLRGRLAMAATSAPLQRLGLGDPWAVLGSFVAGPRALADFAGDTVANSDDRPVVAYLAPRALLAPEATPREHLYALLAQWRLAPQEIVAGASEDDARRLAAYWQARDRYLLAGRQIQPSADVRKMLGQVRGPLLEVLQLSPDFAPAYDPLLRMALALGRDDAPAARALLAELTRLQPARTEARVALQQIETAAR